MSLSASTMVGRDLSTQNREAKVPRSFAVPPDLKELQEQEDRAFGGGGQYARWRTSQTLSTSPIGLPPPPRKKVSQKTPALPRNSPVIPHFFGEAPATSTQLSRAQHPYSNTVVALDDVFRASAEEGRQTYQRRPSAISVAQAEWENQTRRRRRVDIDTATVSNSEITWPRDNLPETSLYDSLEKRRGDRLPRPGHKLKKSLSRCPSLPQLDDFFTPFNPFADDTERHVRTNLNMPKSSKDDCSRTLQNTVQSDASKKHKEQAADAQHGAESDDLSPDRQIGNSENLPWRGRPLYSHAHYSSFGSSNSSATARSSSSNSRPRISIASSKISNSQAADEDTHSYVESDIYSNEYTSSRRSLTPSNHNYLEDTDSYIEFNSPSKLEFIFAGSPNESLLDMPSTSHSKTPFDLYEFMARPNRASPDHSPYKPNTPPTHKQLLKRPTLSRHPSPKSFAPSNLSLPLTTNFLDSDERADLVRKSRKLTRLFGQTPDADDIGLHDSQCLRVSLPSNPNPPFTSKLRHHDALSVSSAVDSISGSTVPSVEICSRSVTTRRHSLPLNPEDISFISVSPRSDRGLFEELIDLQLELDKHEGAPSTSANSIFSGSNISFIDLSDDDTQADSPSQIAPKKKVGVSRTTSPFTRSIYDNMTPEEQIEEERRRKRARLAKLHRFLGSQVPAGLVFGNSDIEATLPPLPAGSSMTSYPANADSLRKVWLRRRRSSSAAAFPMRRSDDIERHKEDLDDKEKAINVRRAQKMEKVFGVAPPQTLFHTRHSPSPSLRVQPFTISIKTPPGQVFMPSNDILPPSVHRNPNRTSYSNKRGTRSDRPRSSDSSVFLLPKSPNSRLSDDTNVNQSDGRGSFVYNHYQQSLISLNDILDRDDRESLAELHDYLHQSEISSHRDLSSGQCSISNTSSRSDRRHSLPSIFSIADSASPDVTDFQMRRRRAAKLTQFFGVDYRELITDVLNSIESGLEHERTQGFLREEQMEDLQERLRTIKKKRQGYF